MGFNIFDELIYLSNDELMEVKKFCDDLIEERDVKADLCRKYDESENEGLKAIREHENPIEAERQENFCN